MLFWLLRFFYLLLFSCISFSCKNLIHVLCWLPEDNLIVLFENNRLLRNRILVLLIMIKLQEMGSLDRLFIWIMEIDRDENIKLTPPRSCNSQRIFIDCDDTFCKRLVKSEHDLFDVRRDVISIFVSSSHIAYPSIFVLFLNLFPSCKCYSSKRNSFYNFFSSHTLARYLWLGLH